MRRLLLLTMISLLIAGVHKIDVNVPDYKKYYDGSGGSRDADPHDTPSEVDDDAAGQSLLDHPGPGVFLVPQQMAPTAKEASLEEQILELYRKKQYAQAETKLNELIGHEGQRSGHWYNLACLQALQGKTDKALDSLAQAVNRGYAQPDQLSKDDDLKSLRDTKRFAKLLEQVTTRARQIESQQRSQQRTRSKLFGQMMSAFRAEKYGQARNFAAEIVELVPEDKIGWYNLACAESRLGNTDKAIKALQRAIEEGYLAFRHMEKDPDLDNLRKTDAYRGILVRSQTLIRTRAQAVLKGLREELGKEYLVEIDHEQKLIFATNIDRHMLDELKKYLSSYAASQRSNLFEHDFEQYVTVILPRQWKLRGVGGLYNPSKRTLTARSLGMVMTHEFTHALHFGDQEGLGQQHPIWITEGLATLFESSRIVEGKVVPQPNYRLLLLKNRAKRNKLLPLDKLTDLSHRDFMQRAAIAYAQSRYLLFYLQDQGKLKSFYDTYTAGYEKDPTGAKALEETTGRKLDVLAKDFRKWVLSQKAPPLRLRPSQAYIGIRMKSVKDGLEVVQAVPGSGADRAGLTAGDVVVKVDHERVVDSSDLLSIVAASDVGDKLTLEIRRNGTYKQVEVTLTAMPQQIPPSTPKNR